MMPVFKIVESEKFPNNKVGHYIEILDGKFSGVCFNFDTLEFSNDDEVVIEDVGEDGERYGKVNFGYYVLTNPIPEEDQMEFEIVAGEILRSILITLFENETNNVNANREDNTQ